MNHERVAALAERLLEAWNSQDVDRVLACYTPAARYRDPNTHAEGAAVHWRASLRLAGGETTIEVDGMDLALLEGDRMHRDDVYFDRAELAPLLVEQPAEAGTAVP